MDITEIAKTISPPIINGVFSILKQKSANDNTKKAIEINIIDHINEILNWSERIQFFGMHEPNMIDNCSIDLSFGIPRKFRSSKYNNFKNEDSLISYNGNLLLLGDPGAGKTTTLKRISRKILLDEPTESGNKILFPILIKLREIQHNGSQHYGKRIEEKENYIQVIQEANPICAEISKRLGLVVTKVACEKTDNLKHGEKPKLYVNSYIGDDLVDEAIYKLLEESGMLILVDGLDEVPRSIRNIYENAIEQIARKTRNSKIILTCRSGDYNNQLEGFSIYEICPLNKKQISNIINRWAINAKSFRKRLRNLPYSDITNRPLFLNQLIISFNYYGDLPKQPNEIYERIINLMLIKWDKDRKVKRESAYSEFNPERKIKFLSAISYELTYEAKSKIFDHRNLERAYRSVCERFGLPENESHIVAQEIESHTGIISQTTDNKYEFSHLSLQEYLCANFIAMDPTLESVPKYLEVYPAPISIAITLSSRPEAFFAKIFFEPSLMYHTNVESIKIMISRLLIERPRFSVNIELGAAFLRLFGMADDDQEFLNNIVAFFDMTEVVKSISLILQYIEIDSSIKNNNFVIIQKRNNIGDGSCYARLLPRNKIPKFIAKHLEEKLNCNLIEYLSTR